MGARKTSARKIRLIKKTKQATKKNRLPNIAQKLPILDIINPTAEIINKIHPIKFSVLLDK